jgi:hypothetical protein
MLPTLTGRGAGGENLVFWYLSLHCLSALGNAGWWDTPCASSYWYMKDENQEIFIAPLASGSKFFYTAIANSCM